MSLRSFKVAQIELNFSHAEERGEVHGIAFHTVLIKFKRLCKFLLHMRYFAQDEVEVTPEKIDIPTEASLLTLFLMMFVF